MDKKIYDDFLKKVTDIFNNSDDLESDKKVLDIIFNTAYENEKYNRKKLNKECK